MQHVESIKRDEEIGVKFMQEQEEKMMERQEGRKEGERLLLSSQIQKKLEKGLSEKEIAALLEVEEAIVRDIIQELKEEKPC